MRLGDFAPPWYPPVLDQAGVSGTVTVEFSIDSAGWAVPGAYRVISRSHEAFAVVTRRAVLAHRFPQPLDEGKPVSTALRMVVEYVAHPLTDSIPTVSVLSHEVMS